MRDSRIGLSTVTIFLRTHFVRVNAPRGTRSRVLRRLVRLQETDAAKEKKARFLRVCKEEIGEEFDEGALEWCPVKWSTEPANTSCAEEGK